MDLKVKKVFDDAIIPTYGSISSAGLDLYAHTGDKDRVVIWPGDTLKIHTGIAASIPDGYFGAIFARSGIATKRGLRPANCVGVVDSDYRGEVIVALHNDTNENQYIINGERVAQLVIIPYARPELIVCEELDDTERGENGFGSTDNPDQMTLDSFFDREINV